MPFFKKKEKIELSERTKELLVKWEAPAGKVTDEFYIEIENNIVKPEEKLLFISMVADVKITDVDAGITKGGIVFISTTRVVYAPPSVFRGVYDDIFEFELRDIHSVGSLEKDNRFFMNGYISFHTSKQQVDFAATSDILVAEKLRDTLIQTIAKDGGEATNENHVEVANSDDLKIIEQKRKVIECKGCGATVITFMSQESQCDYCGRHYILDEFSLNQSDGNMSNIATLSKADEIGKFKKLLDAGIITQEEFDYKKKVLLGM